MKRFLSRMHRGKCLKRVMTFVIVFAVVFSMIPSNALAVRAAQSVGTFEFQGGTKVEDSNAVSFTIGEKDYILALTEVVGTEWGTHEDNAEWRNIPSNTNITFTLTMPEGETNIPSMNVGGAREEFTQNEGVYSFTRVFGFDEQNFYNIQLQLDGQQGPGPGGDNNYGIFEFQGGTKVEDSNAVSFTISEKDYILALTEVVGTEWGTHEGNAEWRNIPSNTNITFTLTMPEGETNIPSMNVGGAREEFTQNEGVYSFTRAFGFDEQNVYNIQLQLDGQQGSGPSEGEKPKGSLNFVCQGHALEGGHIAYKINGESEFSNIAENEEEQIYESLDLNAIESLNSFTIKFETSQGYQLDTARGVNLFVNGQIRYSATGNEAADFVGDNGYTFSLDDILTNGETVADSNFELVFGFENEQGGGGQHGPEPGVISLLCQDLEEAAFVMYRFGTDESKDFIPVENNTIAIPAEETSVTIQFIMNDPEVYKLDIGRGVSLNVNGEEKYHSSGENVGEVLVYTFNLAELAGDKAINESSFELSYGFEYMDPSMDTRSRNMLWVYSEQYGLEHHFVDPQGDVDCLVLNGDVDILSIKYKDTTYSKDFLLELGAKEGEERGDIWYEVDPGNMGYAKIPSGAIVTVKLLPDYGYQVLRAELNGSEIAPTEEQSVFTFTMPTNNLHLSAVFTECKDEVVSSAGDIKSGVIQLGANEIDTGSALLTVEDANNESVFDGTMNKLAGYEIASCLDIGLQQVFYKGTKEDYWSNSKDTLASKATVSLSLADEAGTDVKVLHEKHDGTVEILDATVANGVVTFETDSFSAYAIVKTCKHPVDKVIMDNKTPATCESEGEALKKCTVCGEIVQTGIIVPALGHSYLDGVCARTGCGVVSFTLSKDIALSVEDVKCDGNAHTPVVTVTYKGEKLTKDVDYTVSVNSETAAGTYDVTVTGIGNYRDEITAKWSIYNDTGLWCAEIPNQTYTGKAIKPTLEVFCDGIKLIAGKDYAITYGKYNTNVAAKDAVKSGKSVAPCVTITGKGNYSEKKTMTFAIVPCSVDTAAVNDMLFAKSSKAIKVTPTVKLNGKTLKLGTDYVVSTTTDAAGAITSLKTPGQYDLYVVGKGNYTGYAPFKFTITEKIPANKVTIGKITDRKYDNGNEIKPAVKVTYNKKDKTADFDIAYKNNTEIGTATVTITAKAGTDFVGTKTATFKITGTQMKNAKLGANGKGTIPSRVYDGTAYEPALDLYVGSSPLTQGTDYEVTYTKNVNAGTATATVVGKGKYSGSKKFTYKITAYNAETDAAGLIKINDGADISVVYDKGGSKPNPVVKAGTKVLTNKKDYTISYANQTAVKDKTASKAPKMIITFKGNYSGKKTVLYSITKKDIGNCTMTIGDMVVSTKANGWKQTKATIKDTNGKALKVKTDYNATFEYFSDEGCTTPITVSTLGVGAVVYVKVTGIKNYEGTITGNYRISKYNISSAKASIDSQPFTGSEIKPEASEITVKIGSGKSAKSLAAGTDYEVVEGSYKNNVNKGKASVTIRGINDYCGTKVVTYQIGAKKILWWEL